MSQSAGIVWLASFPRSGNTWTRYVLTRLVFGDASHAGDTITSVRPVRDTILHLPVDRYGLLKTHSAYRPLLPLRERTAGFVLIVRSPLDVMGSLFDYLLRHGADEQMEPGLTIEAARQRYQDGFLAAGGRFTDPVDTWVGLNNTWLDQLDNLPGVVIRYEAMRADGVAEMRRLVDFLGLDSTDDDIAAALAAEDLASMRRREARDMSRARQDPSFKTEWGPVSGYDRGHRFVGPGRVNAKVPMTAAQQQVFADTFGPTLRRLGYHEDGRFDPTASPPTGSALPKQPFGVTRWVPRDVMGVFLR